MELKTPGVLSKENLIDLINKNKINNSIKYSLSSLLKFNINIEPENIKNFVIDNDIKNYNTYFFQN